MYYWAFEPLEQEVILEGGGGVVALLRLTNAIVFLFSHV